MKHSTGGRRFAYRPDIDGLRAIAILPVVFFHAGLGFRGGYVGVDVFFVISGFLIMSVIREEIDRGSFSIVRFWERRMRRLFPALAAVVAATFAAGYVLLLPREFREFGQSLVAQVLMLANVQNWRESGYFATAAEINPLLHMWSLAIEEQFYLLLPPVLLLLKRNPRLRTGFLVLLMSASLAGSAYFSPLYRTASFYLLPTRAWELLLGVLLAQWIDRVQLSRRASEIIGVAGLAAIGIACFAFDSRTVFPGIAALLPCAGTVAVILGGGRYSTGLAPRLLSLKPLVWIGLLSYSLYLWHWPLIAFANYVRFEPLSLEQRLAIVAATVVLAAASWKFIEQPVRCRRRLAARSSLFWCGGLAATMGLLLGVMLDRQGGWPDRFSPEVLSAAAGARDVNPQRSLRHNVDLPDADVDLPRLGQQDDSRRPVLAVIGDSHADSMMPLLDSMCREYHVPAVGITRSATIPLFCEASDDDAEQEQFHSTLRRILTQDSTVRHVLLIARWGNYDSDILNLANVEQTVSELASRGVKVWVFRQVPTQKASIPRAMALAKQWRLDASPALCSLAEYEQSQARFDAIFNSIHSQDRLVKVLDPSPVFFPDKQSCRTMSEGHCWYVDEHHLSAFGALELRRVITPLFDTIVSEGGRKPTAVSNGPADANGSRRMPNAGGPPGAVRSNSGAFFEQLEVIIRQQVRSLV